MGKFKLCIVLKRTKRIFFIFLLYLIGYNFTYSQNLYSGQAIDAINNLPISFCYIFNTNDELISMTNIDGKFEFESNSNNFIFYCMGYDSLYLSLNTKPCSIYLTPKSYNIKEAVITASKVKTFREKINVKKIMPWDHLIKIYANAGSIQTRLILGNGYLGRLRKVYVYVMDDAEPNAYFRIKIYSNLDGRLGYDITPGNIIAKGKPNKWIEIDIEQYQILFPKNGLFIGVETLESNNNKPFQKRFGVKGRTVKSYYGPVIGGVMNSKNWDKEVYFKYEIEDKWWHVQRPLWVVPMIGAEILFYKETK